MKSLFFWKEIRYPPSLVSRLGKVLNKKTSSQVEKLLPELKLGELSENFEAAVKVRIFAITYIWTQSALMPLNDYFFNILRKIPMDGTFYQLNLFLLFFHIL